jgi:hypothetical protein
MMGVVNPVSLTENSLELNLLTIAIVKESNLGWLA